MATMTMALAFVAALSAALLLGAAAACGEKETEVQPSEQAMPEKTITQVLTEHTDNLMSLPGVVGAGQGECSGKPCIKVFVVKKTSDLLRRIPSAIEGYTVEVQESGEIKALDPR